MAQPADGFHMLDARIVHEYIHLPKVGDRVLEHAADLIRFRHIGAGIHCCNVEVALKPMADVVRISCSNPVEHDVHSCRRERTRDAESDAARRTGDDGCLAGKAARNERLFVRRKKLLHG